MTKRATRSLTAGWYEQDPTRGVGLICGKASGNLEMTELEGPFTSGEALDKLRAECDARDITWLWDLLTLDGYAEWTANGGIHTVYRISDHDVPGNTKLAMSADGKATHAETRGEGGFVVVAPTSIKACRHDEVHEEGDHWIVAAGEIGKVPTISWDDRNLLHAAIKAAFDERVERTFEAPAPRPIREMRAGEIKPGDDFEARGDWTQILTERGWSYAGKQNGQDTWARPGKDPRAGHSAAFGHNGSPNIYVWSGMAEGERHYTKFQFVAFSDFNGDWTATTKHLASLGYGTPLSSLPSRDISTSYDYSDIYDASSLTKLSDPIDATAAVNSDGVKPSEPISCPPKPAPRIREFDDLGVARFLAAKDPDKLRFVTQERGWRVYEDGRWTPDRRGGIEAFIHAASDEVKAQAYGRLAAAKEIHAEQGSDESKERLKAVQSEASYAKATASNRGLKALTETLSGMPGIKVSGEDFDQVKHLIPVSNGTFDLKSMELQDHDPANMLTKAIKTAFDPEASAPMWDKALTDWLPDAEQRRYIQRLAGYSLTGDMTHAVVPILHGFGGCGKTQFLEVLRAAFGEFAKTAESNTFQQKKGESTNSVHDLKGARLVTISESSAGAMLNEELVKRFSGGDEVSTRALYQDNQTWKPSGVIWMLTNDLPKFRADDTGMARRIKPIHFAGTFEGSPDRIIGLANKIIESELSGVLNWLLEGVRLYREHGLDEPASISDALKDYQAELDPVTQFLTHGPDAGRIIVDTNQRVKPNELYGAFHAFCVDNKVNPAFIYSMDRFSKRIKALGYESVKSNSSRYIIGIGLDISGGILAAQQPRFSGRQF
jgi:putative DNA primase/helicase